MTTTRNDFLWPGVLALLLAAGLSAASLAMPLPALSLAPWAAAAPALACLVAVALLGRRQPVRRLLGASGIALLVYGVTTAAHGVARGALGGAVSGDAALAGLLSGMSAAIGLLAACGAVAALGRALFPRGTAGGIRMPAVRSGEPRAQAPRAAVPPVAAARPGPAPAAAPSGPGTSFARAPIKRDAKPGPRVTRAPDESSEAPRPAAGPAVLSVDGPRLAGPPPVRPEATRAAAPTPPGRPVGSAPAVPAPGGGWKVDAPEPAVRISFRRIADQLPRDAFVVDLDQVEAGLVESGVLVVPQRLLVPQLPEGVIQVAWEDVADQFPAAALDGPAVALKDRVVDGRLLLPLDEVVSQMPREVFALRARVMDVRGIDEFPSPFSFGLDDGTEAGTDATPAAAAPGAAGGGAARAPIEAEEQAPRAAPPAGNWGDIALADESARGADERPGLPPAPRSVEPGSPTLRIGFDRIAAQFPAATFRMPVDRVAANLLEPGHLLVPRRLVEPQLAEGLVRVAWEDIASQFPPQSLALTAEELRARIAGGMIDLPLDEVVAQLSPETFAMPASRPDLRALEAFPDPFQVEPSGGAGRAAGPAGGAPVAEPEIHAGPEPAAASAVPADAPAASGPAPEAAEAARRPELTPVLEEPGPAPTAVAAGGAPVERAPSPALAPPSASGPIEVFAAALASAGSFEASAARVDDLHVVAFGAPGLPADEMRGAVRWVIGALGAAPGAWTLEQVTVRCAEGALVITPAGGPDAVPGATVVVTAVPRGGTLARIEQLCLGAGGGALPVGAAADVAPAPLERDDAALTEEVARVAETLDVFGPVQPCVLRDPSGELALYVYAPPGDDAVALGALARALYRAATAGPAPLGAVESVACRAPMRRLVVRPVPGAPGRVAVLVAAGAGHGRPGLAHLQAQRAATLLSTL